MTAKKNFSTFGFSAKFSSVDSVLECLSEHSALISVLLSSLYLFAGFISEYFAGKCISVAHQNFLFSLGGALLNGSSGRLLRAEDIRILIRRPSHLICERPLSKNLFVIRRLRTWLVLGLESVAFEGVGVSEVLSLLVNVEIVMGNDVGIVLTLLKFPCFGHLFTFKLI